MDAHDTLVLRLVFLLVFFVVIAERSFELSPRNPKSLLGPGAEIDQLATFRTKRSVYVILPRTLVPASRAFHP
jgi:hypothetical protein